MQRRRALFRDSYSLQFFQKQLPVVCSLKMHRMSEICRFYGTSTAKTLSASGGLRPPYPPPGALPLDPAGALPPNPRYRLALAMGLSPLNSKSWLRPWMPMIELWPTGQERIHVGLLQPAARTCGNWKCRTRQLHNFISSRLSLYVVCILSVLVM